MVLLTDVRECKFCGHAIYKTAAYSWTGDSNLTYTGGLVSTNLINSITTNTIVNLTWLHVGTNKSECQIYALPKEI